MKRRKRQLAFGGILFAIGMILRPELRWIDFSIFFISFLIVGGDVVKRAARNIIRGNVLDENFLMSIATIGAFFIGDFPEGAAVMIFYQVGELFQDYALNQSRKSISELMDIRPDYANIRRGNELVTLDPDEVQIGDIMVIKPGEKVPLDGIILEGHSMLDTKALTGESVPREAVVGDGILSGCININGVITAEVTKELEESTASKILDLVENASSKKSHSEQFITKFARYYTPLVVGIAVLLAVIPPLIIEGATFNTWIYRALTFLVVSCPCALVISIPLSFFGGIGGASRKGILVKGGNYLEALARTEIVVFDKTGTLTKGVFNVQSIHNIGVSKEKLLEVCAYAESYSNHPISQSLQRYYGEDIESERITQTQEIPGHGVIATVDGQEIIAGNEKLMKKYQIVYEPQELIGTTVHIAIDGEYAGYILIADEVKEDSKKAIETLKQLHIKEMVMLTGDSQTVGNGVGTELGIDTVYGELLPIDKVNRLEELLGKVSKKGKLCFVGDGMNDAPVLARADIGIAMGGLGSDAAIEAADIVIMTDEPSKIGTAIEISKKTLRIAMQNIVFAITVKVIILVLSAFGYASMWGAVFGDVGVAIIAILNAFRVFTIKD